MRERPGVAVHPTADVSDQAEVGAGTRIWHQAQVREGAVVGRDCVLGKGAFVDHHVRLGDRCKLQNGVYVYYGFTIEDGVFLGPGVMLLNDREPRAINPDGTLKSEADWTLSEGTVRYGAALGGGVIVLPGVTVGRFAMVGSGAVVTRDVPDRGLVYGNPARLHGFVCDCGARLKAAGEADGAVQTRCPACSRTATIPVEVYRQAREAVRSR
jgi:UDP-2-acetamido-3-amino-2,3-dideoxy-glucuronate N-acetyltransferase